MRLLILPVIAAAMSLSNLSAMATRPHESLSIATCLGLRVEIPLDRKPRKDGKDCPGGCHTTCPRKSRMVKG